MESVRGDGSATGGCCDANHATLKPRSHDTSQIAWAKLMARVGEDFPLECPGCGGVSPPVQKHKRRELDDASAPGGLDCRPASRPIRPCAQGYGSGLRDGGWRQLLRRSPRSPPSMRHSPNGFDPPVCAKFFVAGHQRHIERGGRRNDESVSRVAVHRFGQAAGEDGNLGGDRLNLDFGQAVHVRQPLVQRHAQVKPAASYGSRDFKQTDCGDDNLSRVAVCRERPLRLSGKARSTSKPPHQDMGVDDDQRFMSQSAAGNSGSNGSS